MLTFCSIWNKSIHLSQIMSWFISIHLELFSSYSNLLEFFMIFHPARRFYDFSSIWKILNIPFFWKIFFYFPSIWKIFSFSILLEDFTFFHPYGRSYHFSSGIAYDFPSFWNTQFNFDTHWMDGQTHRWILIDNVEKTFLFICS